MPLERILDGIAGWLIGNTIVLIIFGLRLWPKKMFLILIILIIFIIMFLKGEDLIMQYVR